MVTWFIVLVSFFIALTIVKLIVKPSNSTEHLPPGPFTVPIIGNFLLFRKPLTEIELALRNLHSKLGPVVTLRIFSRPAIFIACHDLAHQSLIQNGAVFSNRPKASPTSKILSSNQHTINSAPYGQTWRVLRRNLTSEILHPSRVKSYSHARKWVLDILVNSLKSNTKQGKPIQVKDHFQYAMFCLLVLMCFGDKLEEKQIKDVENIQCRILVGSGSFNVINFLPKLSKILLRKKWNEFFQLRKEQEAVLTPLINARKKAREERQSKTKEDPKEDCEFVLSYVDTLLDLQLPEEHRKLNEGEMVSLCSEFLSAGTDTTSTALQWIMANIVKYPHVQEKLIAEIKGVVSNDEEKEVKEDDLQKMPYLKALILEGLRRHPPTHLVVPHAVTEETVLGGYVIPKNASVNFMVAEMGWDPKVWKNPMEFKPERFLSRKGGEEEVVDLTGSREIRMMPFGVGRRICPGLGLAMLHLEYFVANLVLKFEWKAVPGDCVDLSEKQEFTTVMKNPLQSCLSPRFGL